MDQQVRGSEGLGLCGSEGAHLIHEERSSELLTFTLDVFRPSSIDRVPARAAFPTENNPIGFQIESTGRDRSDSGLVADPEWGVLPSRRSTKLTQNWPAHIRSAGSRQWCQARHSHAESVLEDAACSGAGVS